MPDDESDKILWQAVRDRDKAQDRALLWKCVAGVLFLLLVWTILELRGCIPAG